MRLSVIIPTLNESKVIAAQVAAVCALEGVDEVVVADGGSTDGTAGQVGNDPKISLVHCGRGRGIQLNAGARASTGDVLLFLHADVGLPPDAAAHVRRALAKSGVVAGAFRTWTVADRPTRLGPLLHLADVRSRYTRLPYGDQALFVRREIFEAVGGYPEQPLMEDLELALQISKRGQIRTVPARVQVSGRRFIARPVHFTLLVNLFPVLYRLGVSPERLARLYPAVR